MEEELQLTREEIAARLNLSVGTIRKWEKEFSRWLVTPPGIKGLGQKKVYAENDVLVFSIVYQARQEGLTIEQVKDALDARLATATRELIPDVPTATGEEAPRVGLQLYMDTIRALEATEGELSATREERDRLLEDLREERDARLDAEKRAASAEGKLELLQGRQAGPSLWSRLFGGGQKPTSKEEGQE
jgi:DNA-binding transcriptional MerR regulator